MLAEQCQGVCQQLLPGGRRDGKTWAAGSVNGEAGQSLRVELSGAKRGIWADFANPEDSGDMLDLWARCKGISLSEAFVDARDWLGIKPPSVDRPAPRTYAKPAPPKRLEPESRVMDYLREDRNLPEASIRAYRIAEQDGRIAFAFLDPDKTLSLVKLRAPEAGAKPVPTAAGCKPVLFGWQAIPDDAGEVTLVEGEIDAPSLHAYGWPALSVPFGGGAGAKQQWIENEFQNLQRFKTIYLALDDDEQGEAASQEIARRLGRHRCKRVILPRKDANACLTEGVTGDEIAACFASADTYMPANLRRAGSYADDVVRLFWPSADDHLGYHMPYGKVGNRLLFRPGEITLWSGDSGHGKSQILSDCTVEWINQGSQVCVASLEMAPQQSMRRLVKQAIGADRPPEPTIRAVADWLGTGLAFYSLVGKDSLKNILEAFDYARACFGCDQFVIDSLMRLGIAGDDYNTQESAVYSLVDWAISNEVHVHLVAHARKGERDRGAPGTADIKGAMEIGANAFNIVTVWRDLKREEKLQSAKDDAARQDLEDRPGVMLNIAKQRNGDFTGKCGLWFDIESYQYRSTRGDIPRCYLTHTELMELKR